YPTRDRISRHLPLRFQDRRHQRIRRSYGLWCKVTSVSKISEVVRSFRSGGQNSRPDCRHCRRSAPQLSDLELSFLDLLRQFDAADRDGRRVESFEPQHRYNPLLEPPMILLDDIVQIFTGSDPHTTRQATFRFQFPDRPMRRRIGVERDHARRSIVPDCSLKETFSRGHISPFAQPKVHCSPVFVDRSIQVGPLSLYLDIGLVTPPGTIHVSAVAAPALFELRNIALHPTQNGGVSQKNSPFRHHPDQVSGTQLEAQVPADTKHNNFLIEMSP